jgi:hypothetical protein
MATAVKSLSGGDEALLRMNLRAYLKLQNVSGNSGRREPFQRGGKTRGNVPFLSNLSSTTNYE